MQTEFWLDSIPRRRQAELLDRHAAFWQRKPASGPLMGFAPRSRLFPLRNLRYEHEGRLHPADVTEAMVRADLSYLPPVDPVDDLFPGKIPLEPLAWSEGYCGANVYFSAKSQTVWTKPFGTDPENAPPPPMAQVPEWKYKLVQVTRCNVEALGSRYLISEPLVRGPADCLGAILGSSRLCLDLYDDPERILSEMGWLTERVIELCKTLQGAIPKYHGGVINRYRVWAPGENIVTQADVATLLSPALFRKLMLPSYRKIAQAFDFATIHLHSSAAQHAEALLSIDEFAAIEWGMDPTGPTLADMLPIFQEILEYKGLILMNIETDEEIDLLLSRLPHAGLCIIRRKDYSEPGGTL